MISQKREYVIREKVGGNKSVVVWEGGGNPVFPGSGGSEKGQIK